MTNNIYTGAENSSRNPIDPNSRFVGNDPIIFAACTPGTPEYDSEEGRKIRHVLGIDESTGHAARASNKSAVATRKDTIKAIHHAAREKHMGDLKPVKLPAVINNRRTNHTAVATRVDDATTKPKDPGKRKRRLGAKSRFILTPGQSSVNFIYPTRSKIRGK